MRIGVFYDELKAKSDLKKEAILSKFIEKNKDANVNDYKKMRQEINSKLDEYSYMKKLGKLYYDKSSKHFRTFILGNLSDEAKAIMCKYFCYSTDSLMVTKNEDAGHGALRMIDNHLVVNNLNRMKLNEGKVLLIDVGAKFAQFSTIFSVVDNPDS